MSGVISDFHNWGCATRSQEAYKISYNTQDSPPTKNYLDQDINSAKVSSDSSKAVDSIKRVKIYISIPKTHQSAWHKIGSQ